MKKLLALLLCFVMMLSLAACGGSSSTGDSSSSAESSAPAEVEPTEPEVDYINDYFTVELPEDFVPEYTFPNIFSDWTNANNKDQRICFNISAYERTAQVAVDKYDGEYETGSVTAGDRTWLYVHAYNNRFCYYTDAGDGHYLEVTVFGYDAEDPAIIAMLASVTLSDTPFEDNQAYLTAKNEARKAVEAAVENADAESDSEDSDSE